MPEDIPAKSPTPTPSTTTPGRSPAQITGWTSLVVAAIVYAVWLLGLAYVAWVNVQAGNQ